MSAEGRFLDVVLADPTVAAVVQRGTGVRDADLSYLDADTSWNARDAVIRRPWPDGAPGR